MSASPVPYIYRVVSIVRVVDGDTLDAAIDVGFRIVTAQRIHLLGIDAPEPRPRGDYTDEEREAIKKAAEDATLFVIDWVDKATDIYVETERSDSFGRWLGTVYRDEDETSLNDALLQNGHAVVYQD